ncbi:Glutathione-dependent formaldehyde-activating enzyme [Aspergillus sclerotialis]|uniref:Glutathione-dependent formaldehyde-activating enzyme n=1 Tax=Aspergillus sclerotialis TaxID=2070753 RepID=A0A3A3A1Z8_9EURO|nr:Glutathione-dependent formaldehyde-activating enzyme [Aspergillus sclerotialis]
MNARCQCKAITFQTPLPQPLQLYICHCTECRHQSSSAFGISAFFPYFEIPDPSGLIGCYTRPTLKGHQLECLFCKNCGARLLHRRKQYVPAPGERPPEGAVVRVRGGCLEGLTKEMLDKAVHLWCKEAVVGIPAGAISWEEEPVE